MEAEVHSQLAFLKIMGTKLKDKQHQSIDRNNRDKARITNT
jgi:hypothetical protein